MGDGVVFAFAPVAMVAIMAVGTAVAAYSAYSSAQAQSKAAKFNSELAERNALIARQEADANAAQQERRARLIQGGAAAEYGASGILGNEGSALDVLASSAGQAELDRQMILYKGQLRGMGFDSQSVLDSYQSSAANTSSYLNAGSTLLLGGAKAYSMSGAGTPTTTTSDLGPVGSNGLPNMRGRA
jgi:hypothetical protein